MLCCAVLRCAVLRCAVSCPMLLLVRLHEPAAADSLGLYCLPCNACLHCLPACTACLYCLQIQVHSLELKLHKRRLLLEEATGKCDLCQEGHKLRRR